MKRILVVDDSQIFLEVARAALEDVGYHVTCANDLAELARVREDAPKDLALVLMDVQMPEVFGDDVALALRHSYGITVPIYLLSSLEDADLAERAKWAGIDGYISKNRGMPAVVEAVQRIVSAGSQPSGDA
jgi:CheY-like chemotaxis protein